MGADSWLTDGRLALEIGGPGSWTHGDICIVIKAFSLNHAIRTLECRREHMACFACGWFLNL